MDPYFKFHYDDFVTVKGDSFFTGCCGWIVDYSDSDKEAAITYRVRLESNSSHPREISVDENDLVKIC